MRSLLNQLMCVSLTVAAQQGASLGKDRHTVCQALEDRVKLNHHMIELVGVVKGDGFLETPGCTYMVTTNGYIWRNLIAIVRPSDDPRFPFNRADFRTDEGEVDKAFKEAIKNAQRLRKGYQLEVTYEGELVTDDLSWRVSNANGKWYIAGFGVQNLAPAQLLVKTVKRIVVIPSSK